MTKNKEKIIKNFDEAISYIEEQDSFHDYILGNLEVNYNSITIMIEEDTKEKHNENAHIWDFTFQKISALKFTMDCILPSYIAEILIENQAVVFELTNGYISFYAEDILLGIPQTQDSSMTKS